MSICLFLNSRQSKSLSVLLVDFWIFCAISELPDIFWGKPQTLLKRVYWDDFIASEEYRVTMILGTDDSDIFYQISSYTSFFRSWFLSHVIRIRVVERFRTLTGTSLSIINIDWETFSTKKNISGRDREHEREINALVIYC